MAKFYEPTETQLRNWSAWVRSLPRKARQAAITFNPWTLYRIKKDGHRVTLKSFSDDGTITVIVSGKFNLIFFEREVFGLKPSDLEECDLPSKDEPLGAMMTQDEVTDNIDLLRAAVRPDLWVMDETGKAVRKQ